MADVVHELLLWDLMRILANNVSGNFTGIFQSQTGIPGDAIAMQGLVNYEHPGVDRSDFESFFGQLVRSRPAYCWLIKGSAPWSWPYDWSMDDAVMDAIDQQLEWLGGETGVGPPLASTDFMDRYMRYLSDDWIEIYGFPRKPTDLTTTIRWDVGIPPGIIQCPREAEYVFVNFGGAFWALLCESESELRTIHTAWPNSKYLDVESLSIPKWRPV